MRILNLILRATDFQITVLFPLHSSLGRFTLRHLPFPHTFSKSVCLEPVTILRNSANALLHSNPITASMFFSFFWFRMSVLVLLQSNHVSAIEGYCMLLITATYLCSCHFMYLCISCYCHGCLGLLRCVWPCRRCTVQCNLIRLFVKPSPECKHMEFSQCINTALIVRSGTLLL